MYRLPIGQSFEFVIDQLTVHMRTVFDQIGAGVTSIIDFLAASLMFPHPLIVIGIMVGMALALSRRGLALFTAIGMLLIWNMRLWEATMDTLALVIASVFIALVAGLPLGIWASKNTCADRIIRPVLDFMQTLPAFVYLIPAVLFFKLGPVPGVIATLIFSLPPVVRLTCLGIRQVPEDIRQAAISFGCSRGQLLFKAELPVALPTIMAGINQTIMLALSMVVIAGMIGAGGLGNVVLKGITQLKIDKGFEGGISIVILAIFLDRITQAVGEHCRKNNK